MFGSNPQLCTLHLCLHVLRPHVHYAHSLELLNLAR